MAYKAQAPAGTEKYLYGFKHFWAIHKGVGWGYDNNYDDVMLVQFLFNNANAHLRISENLQMDGIFGKKTQKAIRAFQKKYQIHVDGKVNPVDGADRFVTNTSGQAEVFTNIVLNEAYVFLHPIYYLDIRMDPQLPQPLAHLLSV